jgi:hypothetical protein
MCLIRNKLHKTGWDIAVKTQKKENFALENQPSLDK